MKLPLTVAVLITLLGARMLCAQAPAEGPNYFGKPAPGNAPVPAHALTPAGTPVPLPATAEPQDLIKLRQEYAARTEATQAWYASELHRLETSLTARGDAAGARDSQRERELIPISGIFSWHGPGETSTDEITFHARGIGKHTFTPFVWQSIGLRTFALARPGDGARAVITFNETYSAYKGTNFGSQNPIEGERK